RHPDPGHDGERDPDPQLLPFLSRAAGPRLTGTQEGGVTVRVTKEILAGIGLAIACAGAVAQPYPSKPIRFVVATAAGGASDIVARTVAERMQEGLGQPIVVEAKPGAHRNLAAEYVAKAPADGYTMMMGTIGVMAINVSMYRKTPFDPLTDFTAVA